MADLERIAGRIALRNARPRDLSSLRESLLRLPELRAPLAGTVAPLLAQHATALTTPDSALDLLSRAIASCSGGAGARRRGRTAGFDPELG